MPTSIREQVIAAIVSATGGEYGVPAPESERDLPITIVQDGPEEASTDAYGYTMAIIPVAVAEAVESTTTDKDLMRIQANELLAGVIATMFADETFGGLADGVEYIGGGIQTEVGKFVFAEAQFAVRYHTVRGDPYTID